MKPKKTYYLFDSGGNLIEEFKGRKELADKLKIKLSCLNSCIKRKSLLQRRYYICTENNIDIKSFAKKYTHNPILKSRSNHLSVGISNRINYDLDYLQHDLFD